MPARLRPERSIDLQVAATQNAAVEMPAPGNESTRPQHKDRHLLSAPTSGASSASAAGAQGGIRHG